MNTLHKLAITYAIHLVSNACAGRGELLHDINDTEEEVILILVDMKRDLLGVQG